MIMMCLQRCCTNLLFCKVFERADQHHLVWFLLVFLLLFLPKQNPYIGIHLPCAIFCSHTYLVYVLTWRNIVFPCICPLVYILFSFILPPNNSHCQNWLFSFTLQSPEMVGAQMIQEAGLIFSCSSLGEVTPGTSFYITGTILQNCERYLRI